MKVKTLLGTLFGTVLLASIVLAVFASSSAQAANEVSLLVSRSADRSSPTPVDGDTFDQTDSVYIFATTNFSPRKGVYFYVDGSEWSSDRFVPYDMQGGTTTQANAVNLGQLSPGQHTIVAYAVNTSNDYYSASGTVTITGEVIPPPPPPTSRDQFLWPYAADSPWNTPIGSAATYSGPADLNTLNLIDPQYPVYANADQYSMPMYRSTASDPLVAVSYEWAAIEPYANGTISYHIPTTATPASGTDRHMHVLDPDGHTIHETWNFRRKGRTATAGKYAPFDLYGPGIGHTYGDNWGSRAYGGSGVAGLIRTWEFDSGVIRHALALALVNNQLMQGPVWPATSEDSTANYYAGQLPMGSLVAIPADVDLGSLGLSSDGLMLAKALQDYGAYIVDRSANLAFYAEPNLESRLGSMRNDLNKIRAKLTVVTNNSATSVGGGGTPRAPLAPPFQ